MFFKVFKCLPMESIENKVYYRKNESLENI